MDKSTMIEEYLNWIKYDLLQDEWHDSYDSYNHSKLFNKLFETDYMSDIPMDQNRIVDGLNLRYEYGKYFKIPTKEIELFNAVKKCSVLEVMVALARRAHLEIFFGYHEEITPVGIFWMMVDNMKIGSMIDGAFNERYVECCLLRMMGHKYQKSGYGGGMFVISDNNKDMRSAELWYQMQWWANEYINWENNGGK